MDEKTQVNDSLTLNSEQTIMKPEVKTGWIVYLILLIALAVGCIAVVLGVDISPVVLFVIPLLVLGIALVLIALIKTITSSGNKARNF